MIDKLNEIRARAGLPALRPNAQLAEAAKRHVDDLSSGRVSLTPAASHIGSDGTAVVDRVQATGYSLADCREMTGWGWGGIAYRLVDFWMQSQIHFDIIHHRDMTECGWSYAYRPADPAGWGHYWVVVMARPLGQPGLPEGQPGEHVVYTPVVVGGGSAAVDLLPYLRGDGRAYRVGNAGGSYEVFQTQAEGDTFYQVKAWDDLSIVNWEGFRVDSEFIRRDVDTSPGGGRFYRQFDAPWIRRYMRPGESFRQAKRLQFYRLEDCAAIEQHSGHVTDTIRLVARYDRLTFPARDWPAVTLDDVIELEWGEGGEVYHYARGYGLVGWSRRHQDPHSPAWSAICEMRPGVGRLERLRVDCPS